MDKKRYAIQVVPASNRGFTLLEIALSLGILSVVAIYTLNMYQSVSTRKRLTDDHVRMEEIVTALKAYYGGHEALPAAGTSFLNSIPFSDLGLDQSYRFDTHGRPYLYFSADTAANFLGVPRENADFVQVDGRSAAGVVISLGEDQIQGYLLNRNGPIIGPLSNYSIYTFTTQGDDLLVPVEVNTEAVGIALAELEILGKRVESYNRTYAGIQDNGGTDYYGDTAAGAPPILDPDYYDLYFSNAAPAPAGTYPQLYPYISSAYPVAAAGNTNYVQPSADWPTALPAGPPPTFTELVQHEPRNWPGGGAYDGTILNTWEADLAPTSAGNWVWPPPGNEEPEATGTRPLPPAYTVTDPGFGFFGVYPSPPYYLGTPVSALPAYELIDEGGCQLVGGVVPDDPSCGFVYLDTNANPVGFIRTQYGLGSSLATDPWGNPYLWGGVGVVNTDPRYHLFYSAGPDGTAGTADDVLLF